MDPPGLSFVDFPVFRLREHRAIGYDFAVPPVDFLSPSGLHPSSTVLRWDGKPPLTRTTPLGFCALRRMRLSRSSSAGLPSPARARPTFLRLGRTGPQTTSNAGRVCFTPATPLSFSLQGFVLRPEIQDSFPSPDPPMLLEAGDRSLSFGGFLPLDSGRLFVRHFQADKGPMPSWSFFPSEALPSSAGSLGFPKPSSCVLFPSHRPKGKSDGRNPGVLPAEDRFLAARLAEC